MKKIIFIVLWWIGMVYAGTGSSSKVIKLSQKGERIVKVMCDAGKLPEASGTIEAVMERIRLSKACHSLSRSKLEAVAYYISSGISKEKSKHIDVPHDAKCPVCGMFVSKYPKWVATMDVGQKRHYFDGVKDMMKYYIFDGNFIYNRKDISTILVSDYYTLEAISAKEAFYVLDSDVYGPMGHELIPFKTEKSAQLFKEEHNGKKVVQFHEITDSMVMKLDGIEQ